MKKFFTLITVAALFAFTVPLFAEESQMDFPKDKFSLGSYALVQSRKSGGGIGLGIPLFQKNAFCIKDEVNLNLYLANSSQAASAKAITLGDKIQFGSLKEHNGFAFRTYGYAKVEFGITSDASYGFFTAPMILETGGAGGFEFLFNQTKGFFVEFGGGAVIKGFGSVSKVDVAAGSFDGSYVCITTGIKRYF